MIYIRRCLCTHISHEKGEDHPPSAITPEENMIVIGWKGATFEVCHHCAVAHPQDVRP